MNIQKKFDVKHWLAKLLYIPNGLHQLTRLLGSRTFSRVFSAAIQVECIPVTYPTPPKDRFKVTSDGVAELLMARGITVVNEDIKAFLQDTTTGVSMLIAKLRGSLNANIQISSTSRRFRRETAWRSQVS